MIPEKDSPFWPWLNAASAGVLFVICSSTLYNNSMSVADIATLATICLSVFGLSKLQQSQ